jgi:signal transduction histidine kinase
VIGFGSQSLQLRLATRLAALYLAATVAVIGVLIYRAYDTAGSLSDRELSLRASDLADYVSRGPDGAPRLELPPKLKVAYDAAPPDDIFAIRSASGMLVAAAPPEFGKIVANWPPATDDPSYFRLSNIGAGLQSYYGLSVSVDSVAGPLSISVARAGETNALITSLLREFVLDLAWLFPLFVFVTLAIGYWALRSGLRPVREISQRAAAIGPNAISERLPEKGLPSEIMPLVVAVNRALDRLEQGFAVQRQFTANAAHQLRTPLAIVTAALETTKLDGEVVKIRSDVARMNRLVDQLLSVARLDAVALDVSGRVNLNDAAAEVVGAMAPLATAQGRKIGFEGQPHPVWVKGNAYAIVDAIRNLAENAIAYSPPGTETTIAVYADGRVSVADHGPGIAAHERPRIFERFWQGERRQPGGAGLGLSIVQEIMKAHGGSVDVGENPGDVAIFTLRFKDPRSRRPTDIWFDHSQC